MAKDGGSSREGRTTSAGSKEEDEELSHTVERSIDQGDVRLHRSLRQLVATGFVGGSDVGVGIGALLLVKEKTGNEVLASLAFTIGFIALTLAHSELFTEDFLLPIMAVAAGRDRPGSVARLWLTVGLSNLAGGWVTMGLFAMGFPELKHTAIEVGSRYSKAGIGRQSFALAILGGAVITLMTWMERRADSDAGRLAGAIIAGFVLALGSLEHAVVASLEMFSALQYGAPFGYASWLGVLAWSVCGNVVGGSGLVAGLRLIQIGPAKLRAEREISRRDNGRRRSGPARSGRRPGLRK